MRKLAIVAFIAMPLFTTSPVSAGSTILTVVDSSRDIESEFTLEYLKSLPQHHLVTSTSVTDGKPEFSGFLVRDLLERLGTEGDIVVAHALNGYRMEIPASDFEEFDVLGAITMDGEPLSPRDKGPIWIVYPRDDHRKLQDIRYDTRWVWQLEALHIQ